MIDKVIAFLKRVGAKLGFVREINRISEHKKIAVSEDTYNRISINKAIYQGKYEPWHKISYRDNKGVERTYEMLTMGIAKVVAEEMASLVFNEKCKIDVSTKDNESETNQAKDFVLEVFKDNHFYRDFQRYLEYGYALGGFAIKVYEHEGKIKFAYAVADSFIPLSQDSENIDEALFVTQEKKDNKFYTLLEWNEWRGDTYVITNELYESDTQEKLGHTVPLSTLYEDLEARTEIENLTRPMFIYIKPNIANNRDLQSPLGISIYDNAHDIIRQLDYQYDYFMHEFKLGKRRIAVDREMMRPINDGYGNLLPVFDTDNTVFMPMNGGADGFQGVKDLTVGLRVSDIVNAINFNLDVLAMNVGFSQGAFNFSESGGLATATQVISENSKTFKTKKSHETLIEHGIKQLVITILEVANLTGVYNGSTDVDVTVDFDDSIVEDRQSNYNYYSSAVKDGLMPKKEAIMRQFKLTEQEAMSWIAEIQQEQRLEMTNDINGAIDLMGIQTPIRDIGVDND